MLANSCAASESLDFTALSRTPGPKKKVDYKKLSSLTSHLALLPFSYVPAQDGAGMNLRVNEFPLLTG
jgi:hypothetical protein